MTWNDTILDGHNRYELCQKHEIGFKCLEKEFDNEDEAKIWIIRNQLARRNLPPHERVRLALILKPIVEQKIKDKEHERKTTSQISDESPLRTDEEIGRLANVSRNTVRKSEVIEKEAPPDVKDAVRKGKMSINKAYKATRKAVEQDSKTDKQLRKEEKAKQKATESKTKKLVKSKTLGKLRYYWSIADDDERKEFKQWIKREGN